MKAKTVSVAEMAEIIHQHQTQNYGFFFKVPSDLHDNTPAALHKVIVAAEEDNYVLLIRNGDNSKKMAFRLLIQPTSISAHKCLVMYWRYLGKDVCTVIVAEAAEDINLLSRSMREPEGEAHV